MAKSTPLSRKLAGIAVAGVILSGGAVAAASAVPTAIISNHQVNPGATDDSAFWNRFQLDNGMFAFCAGDPQNPGALNAKVYDTANLKHINGAFTSLGNSTWDNAASQAAGYLLSKYGADTSVDPAAVQYAVMNLASNPYSPAGLSQAQIDKGNQLMAEAKANAAVYDGLKLANPTVTVDSAANTGVVKTNLVAGNYSVTYTVTGGATFAGGSTTTTVDASKATDLKLVIPAGTAAGNITVNAEATNVPTTGFDLMTSADYQDLFIAGQTTTLKASASAAYAPVVKTPSPSAPTTPTPVTSKTPVATPSPSTSTTPAPVVTETATSTKTATPSPSVSTTPAPVVTETATSTKTATPSPSTSTTPAPVVTETATSTATATPSAVAPTVSTVASGDTELKGGKASISDTIKVEGTPAKGSYVITRLYKFSDGTDKAAALVSGKCTDETLVPGQTDEKIVVNTAGEYQSTPVTVTAAGVYGFQETLYDANGNVISQANCTTESETVVVKDVQTPVATTPAAVPSQPVVASATPTNTVRYDTNTASQQKQHVSGGNVWAIAFGGVAGVALLSLAIPGVRRRVFGK